MTDNEKIPETSTEAIQTASTETSNQRQNSEEVKQRSKWLRKWMITLAAALWIGGVTIGVIESCQDPDEQMPSPENINRPTETEITTKTSSALVANLEDTDSQPNPEKTSTEWVLNWNVINEMLAWGEANDTASTGTIQFETVQQQNKKAFDALFISTATWYHSKDAKRIEELAKSVGLWSDEAFDNAIVYIVTSLQGEEIDFWGWDFLTSEQQRQFEEKWRVKNWNTFVWGGTEVVTL